jgi:hypothetical protein
MIVLCVRGMAAHGEEAKVLSGKGAKVSSDKDLPIVRAEFSLAARRELIRRLDGCPSLEPMHCETLREKDYYTPQHAQLQRFLESMLHLDSKSATSAAAPKNTLTAPPNQTITATTQVVAQDVYSQLIAALLVERGRLIMPTATGNAGPSSSKDGLMLVPLIRDEGEPNAAHQNVSKLLKAGRISEVHTGYALSDDRLWRYHSWGVDAHGRIVETTVERIAYFGMDETEVMDALVDAGIKPLADDPIDSS